MNFIFNIEPFCHTFWRPDVPLAVMTGVGRGVRDRENERPKTKPLPTYSRFP